MQKDIRQILGITFESPYWDEALAQATQMEAVPQWLTEGFVRQMEKEFDIAGAAAPAVLQARAQIVENEALCLLAKVIYVIIGLRKSYSEAFPNFTLPEGDANNPGYDFVAFFPVLAHLRLFEKELAERGITGDIFYDNLHFMRYSIKSSTERTQRPSYDKAAFSIYGVSVYCKTFMIGRLRFEIHPDSNRNARIFSDGSGNLCTLMCDTVLHRDGNILGAVGYEDEEGAYAADYRETDDYYEGYPVDPATGLAVQERRRLTKGEWHPVMEPGDTLIKVHIPNTGKLLPEACEEAYTRARQLLPKCFPEYDFKGFVCNCWMLSPALGKILKKDSNIMRFQEKYTVFPAKNMATDVFLYVYDLRVSSAAEVDIAALPEDNSMRTGVKKLLQEGTYVHQFNGFIPLRK